MATVIEGMEISSEEVLSDNGLTSLQQRVLYQLMLLGELHANLNGNHDAEVGKALGSLPGLAHESASALARLVEMGMVRRVITAKSDGGFGGKQEVQVATKACYRPTQETAVGHHVMAYVTVYGALSYDELSTPDCSQLISMTLCDVLGEPRDMEGVLLREVQEAVEDHGLVVQAACEPSTRGGGRKSPIPVAVTHITLRAA